MRAIGLVDLLTLLEQFPVERAAALATCIGFAAPADEPVATAQPSVAERDEHDEVVELPSELLVEVASEPPPVPLEALPALPDVSYWRAEHYEPSPDVVASEGAAVPPPTPLAREAVDARRRPLRGPLPWPSLTPWSRLWPLLHAALQGQRLGRRVDIDALVGRWSRGRLVRTMPRLRRRVWPTRVALWIDRSQRLIPFWGDQDELTARLRNLLGKSAVSVTLLPEAAQGELLVGGGALLDAHPALGPLLVLSDLGRYATEDVQSRWHGVLAAVARQGVDATALVPATEVRLAPVATGVVRRVAWERTPQAEDEPLGSDGRAPAVARLLGLCAMAGFVEPALMRELRHALPTRAADATTEAALWNDPDVDAPDSNGLVVRPERLDHWRKMFVRTVSPEVRQRVAEAITRRHAVWAEELLHAETLVWASHGEGVLPGDLAAAEAFVRDVTEASRDERDPQWAEEMRAWARSFLQQGVEDEVYARVPALQRLWASAYRGLDVRVPRPIDRAALERELGGGGERRVLDVWQVGGELRIGTRRPEGPGSPFGTLGTTLPHVLVDDGNIVLQCTTRGDVVVQLRRGATVHVSTEEGRLTVAPWVPGQNESWMSATGRDAFGLWAEFEVKEVTHRMRWIPPGRFWMGSPEDEAGRLHDEGPYHAVDLTLGYWLGETPVTQALWEAVMGDKPSHFLGRERPVELVSWNECKTFMLRLENLISGLCARFPTEAEWERACRAGMAGESWIGAAGEERLNTVAWWHGNSGRATHSVYQKAGNPYSLYDMLGNVWEWCDDSQRTYETGPVRNPCGASNGPFRVYRGGSWLSDAASVRAAARFANSPSFRDSDLGFRLARGRAPCSGKGSQEAAESPRAANAEWGPDGQAMRDAVAPHGVDKPWRR